eukprot:gene11546-12741_t
MATKLKEQIILNCTSNALRRKALREDLDLTSLLKAGKALELSESQAKEVEQPEKTTNVIRSSKRSTTPRRANNSIQSSRNTSTNAQSKHCGLCAVCRTKPPQKQNVRAVTQQHENVTEDEEDEDRYLYTIRDPKRSKKSPMCEIDIDETRVKVMIDSGSTVNVIDETTFKKINNASRKRLKPTNHRIYAYGNDAPLPLSGTFEAILKSKDRVQTNAIMHVVSGNYGNLLGLDTALELGVLQITNVSFRRVRSASMVISSALKGFDPTQSLVRTIETDIWTDPTVKQYIHFKGEVAVYNGMLLTGNRIIIHQQLRERAVELAHVGHQGIVKTKQLIREKVWFPHIDQMVKDKIDRCLPCQAAVTTSFHHRKITPIWPQANGEAERFMRNISKCVTIAHLEAKNWKQEIFKYLRQYRATPHSTTLVSPFEALNNRKMRTTLPEVMLISKTTQKIDNMRERDGEQKRRIKEYADTRRKAAGSTIKPGETVLVKQPKTSKLSTPYNPKAMVVDEVKGSMVTASNDEKTITRNSSHFKAISSETVPVTAVDDVHEMLDHRNEDAEDTLSSETTRPVRSRKPPGWLKDFVTD